MELKNYFHQKYQGGTSFVDNVIIPIFGLENWDDGFCTPILEDNEDLRIMAEKLGISSVSHLGTIDVSFNPINVYDVTVSDHVMLQRNRVSIQSLTRKIMDSYSSVFMIFHYQNTSNWDWRFSFCRKGKDSNNFTNNKRFTFLLGPNQSCRTIAENFSKLALNKNIQFQDIESAFDVEALSDEFFDKYKAHYMKFVDYMCDERHGMRDDFVDNNFSKEGLNKSEIKEREEKSIRDYVKKLLGRIVFLHFLQKKGWLGVKKDCRWGLGDLNFMKHLFEKSSDSQKKNFLEEVLEPLFVALDTDRSDNDDLYDTHVVLDYGEVIKIPYLNGGLFEVDNLDKEKAIFPSEYFRDLFEFFYEYNFTIDENDPNDAQVGIDPEMLGRIFENLLEDNKDKGAYYTPKEVVKYMCKESLISYLQTDIDEDSDKTLVEEFVKEYNVDILKRSSLNLVEEIDKKLVEVKICDPAIGSGAFPMGLLKELFYCRGAIEKFDDASDIKRSIIKNNIYGVDIEKGAVDIARLRFWLSLIVDEVSPHTLPNLDYKIMQGNSLVEQYKNVDLSRIATKKEENFNLKLELYNEDIDLYRDKIINDIERYYSCCNKTDKNSIIKDIHENVMCQINKQEIPVDISDININSNSTFFLWHTWFNDVFSRDNSGFDIVIGNPPYGAKLSSLDKDLMRKIYTTANNNKSKKIKASLDTYTLFIELAFNLLRKRGSFAMIIPLSFTSSDSLSGIHNLLLNNCNDIYVSSYAVRPQPVFKNAVVNTSIVLFRKTLNKCQHIFSTKLNRKSKNFNLQELIDHLCFVDVSDLLLYGRIPKISCQIEVEILNKLFKHKPLAYYMRNNGSKIVYRFAGGRYFKIITNYSNGASSERNLYFDSEIANSIGCILSSNLSFWFYQIYSDNLNWKNKEISEFRIPDLDSNTIKELDELYKIYLDDIEKNANIRNTSADSSYNVASFKEYKIGKSKKIIDRIDDIIGPLYGLNKEEINFIKNYEIEYRLSDVE